MSAKPAKGFDTVNVEGPSVGYELAPVTIRKADQAGFYVSVSNAVLWPLLHSFPTTMRVSEAPWKSYVRANEAFAKVTVEVSRGSDPIWIHDYHLMLAPALVRAERPKARIGWFCHIPWCPAHLFGILPWREAVLEGLLGATLLGFHTDEYVHYFLECVDRFLDAKVDHGARTVRYRGRTTRVIAAPIGIPVAALTALATEPDVVAEMERIRHSVGNRRIVLGVDRLDYTKGIPERILAFEELLRTRRSAASKYVLLQVMVPSRTDVRAYAELKEEIDRMVGSLNGRYSVAGRIPVHYFFRNLNQRSLFAHYRAADVALVTPLRDGMNLVAHEYVASRAEGDGVLVLSEFAGAAKHLKEALLVNPYDIPAVAETLERALHLPEAEAHKRMRALRNEVRKLDVHRWAEKFIKELES